MKRPEQISIDELIGTPEEPRAEMNDEAPDLGRGLERATRRMIDSLTPKERELLERRFGVSK